MLHDQSCFMIDHAYGGAFASYTANFTLKDHVIKMAGKPLSMQLPRKRHRLFLITFKFFPASLLAKIVAFLLTMSPLIFNYLLEHYAIDSIVTRGLLTIAIVGGIPTVALYLITFVRAPSIRKREEMQAALKQDIIHKDLKA
jgi:hypothetical protein